MSRNSCPSPPNTVERPSPRLRDRRLAGDAHRSSLTTRRWPPPPRSRRRWTGAERSGRRRRRAVTHGRLRHRSHGQLDAALLRHQPCLDGARRRPSSRCPPAAPRRPVEPRSGARRRIRPAPRPRAAPAAGLRGHRERRHRPPRSCRRDPPRRSPGARAGRAHRPRPTTARRSRIASQPRSPVAGLTPANVVGQPLDRGQADSEQLAVDVGRKRGFRDRRPRGRRRSREPSPTWSSRPPGAQPRAAPRPPS